MTTAADDGFVEMPEMLSAPVGGVSLSALRYAPMDSTSDRIAAAELLERFHAEVQLRKNATGEGGADAELVTFNDMREQDELELRTIGHVRGVQPGRRFDSWAELAVLGIHTQIGSAVVRGGARPCFAFVLTGRDANVDDAGAVVTWRAAEGPGKAKELTAVAAAAAARIPVRVCRQVTEPDGSCKFAYDGLYVVTKLEGQGEPEGTDCSRFQLRAIRGHSTVSRAAEPSPQPAAAPAPPPPAAPAEADERPSTPPPPQPPADDDEPAEVDTEPRPRSAAKRRRSRRKGAPSKRPALISPAAGDGGAAPPLDEQRAAAAPMAAGQAEQDVDKFAQRRRKREKLEQLRSRNPPPPPRRRSKGGDDQDDEDDDEEYTPGRRAVGLDDQQLDDSSEGGEDDAQPRRYPRRTATGDSPPARNLRSGLTPQRPSTAGGAVLTLENSEELDADDEDAVAGTSHNGASALASGSFVGASPSGVVLIDDDAGEPPGSGGTKRRREPGESAAGRSGRRQRSTAPAAARKAASPAQPADDAPIEAEEDGSPQPVSRASAAGALEVEVEGAAVVEMPPPPPAAKTQGLTLQYAPVAGDDDVEWARARVAKFRQQEAQHRAAGAKKPDYKAATEVDPVTERRAGRTVVGHVRGVRPGQLFSGRAELATLHVQCEFVAGIDVAKPAAAEALAIAVVSAKPDTTDHFSQGVWYDGAGSENEPQSMTKYNLALKVAKELGTPVRYCHACAPEPGMSRAYVYRGLYVVTEIKEDVSKHQHLMYRFKLNPIKGHAVSMPPPPAPGPSAAPSKSRRASRSGAARGRSRASRNGATPAPAAAAAAARDDEEHSPPTPDIAPEPQPDEAPAADAHAPSLSNPAAPPVVAAEQIVVVPPSDPSACKLADTPPAPQAAALDAQQRPALSPAPSAAADGGGDKTAGREGAGDASDAPPPSRPEAAATTHFPYLPPKRGRRARPPVWNIDNDASERQKLEADRKLEALPGLLDDDITRGQEPVRIPLINDTGVAVERPDFKYTRDYGLMSPLAAEYVRELAAGGHMRWAGCDRTSGDKPDFAAPRCIRYHHHMRLEHMLFTPLIECRRRCRNPRCNQPNLTDRSIWLPLQVFYSQGRGWCLRCEVDIPVGAFVCCCIGRVITSAEAEAPGRADSPYLVPLDHFVHVMRTVAGDPTTIEPHELRVVPSLPTPEFFSWAARQHVDRAVHPEPSSARDSAAKGPDAGQTTAATTGDEVTGVSDAGATPADAPAATTDACAAAEPHPAHPGSQTVAVDAGGAAEGGSTEAPQHSAAAGEAQDDLTVRGGGEGASPRVCDSPAAGPPNNCGGGPDAVEQPACNDAAQQPACNDAAEQLARTEAVRSVDEAHTVAGGGVEAQSAGALQEQAQPQPHAPQDAAQQPTPSGVPASDPAASESAPTAAAHVDALILLSDVAASILPTQSPAGELAGLQEADAGDCAPTQARDADGTADGAADAVLASCAEAPPVTPRAQQDAACLAEIVRTTAGSAEAALYSDGEAEGAPACAAADQGARSPLRVARLFADADATAPAQLPTSPRSSVPPLCADGATDAPRDGPVSDANQQTAPPASEPGPTNSGPPPDADTQADGTPDDALPRGCASPERPAATAAQSGETAGAQQAEPVGALLQAAASPSSGGALSAPPHAQPADPAPDRPSAESSSKGDDPAARLESGEGDQPRRAPEPSVIVDLDNFQAVWKNERSPEEARIEDGPLTHLVVDAERFGNVSRFLRHSCDPNLDRQVILKQRAGSAMFYYIGFFACKADPIPAYTELTIDRMRLEGGGQGDAVCDCGASSCVGRASGEATAA